MSYFPSPTITTDAALRDLGSAKPRVRAAAAAALGDAEDARRPEAVAALLRSLDDIDPDVRASSALSLGDLRDAAAVEPLVLRLDDGIPAVRQSAAVALGRLGLSAAFEPLARALARGPADVRFQAATSLCEIDPVRALEPLLAALRDADAEVVGAAALGLGAIGDRAAAEPLAALLDHASPRTRFDVAYGLAGLGDGRAVAVLAGFARDRELCWDAIEGLEQVGSSAAGRLAELIEHAPTPEHRLRAAAALLAVAPEHGSAGVARHALEDALRARRHLRRALAVELVGRSGGAWATRALEELRQSRGARRIEPEIDDALRAIREREENGAR
jgi:HEAT repeat protein